MKIKNNKFSYVYFTLLLIVILLLIFIPKVTESYENINKKKNKKVNLTCEKGQHNDYNCKSFVPEDPKTEIITKHINYPSVIYEKGIGSKKSTGKILFKKKYDEIPSIQCQPIINKELISDSKNPLSINISVYNITLKGFEYKKSIISSKEEYNGLTSLEEDNENTFSWIALSDPKEKPNSPIKNKY